MYSTLLTTTRIRPSSRGGVTLLQEAESDRSRVVYSPSFRRLQGKTQVFPLTDNAAVRTRLTHSLEVSNVGRFLAASALEGFDRAGRSQTLGLDGDLRAAFTSVTETACLLHDIGNPPFGHFGEGAIASWFETFQRFESDDLKSAVHAFPGFLDLTTFDGNPQGFRIACKLAGSDGMTGMNLTLSQLAAMLKYSATASERRAAGSDEKSGVFHTELLVLDRIREEFKLKPGQRFPVAYLMEAADDISYCLSDIEDGIEMGVLTHDAAVAGIVDACKESSEALAIVERAKSQAVAARSVDPVVAFRASLIRSLVEYAAGRYVAEHAAILEGRISELIEKESAHGKLLAGIKSFARSALYEHRIPSSLELSGGSIIGGLLDQFGRLLQISRGSVGEIINRTKKARKFPVESRLLSLIAKSHLDCYRQYVGNGTVSDAEEWCVRAHMVVDYISGMTDHFALDSYRRLLGIRL